MQAEFIRDFCRVHRIGQILTNKIAIIISTGDSRANIFEDFTTITCRLQGYYEMWVAKGNERLNDQRAGWLSDRSRRVAGVQDLTSNLQARHYGQKSAILNLAHLQTPDR